MKQQPVPDLDLNMSTPLPPAAAPLLKHHACFEVEPRLRGLDDNRHVAPVWVVQLYTLLNASFESNVVGSLESTVDLVVLMLPVASCSNEEKRAMLSIAALAELPGKALAIALYALGKMPAIQALGYGAPVRADEVPGGGRG